MSETQDNVIVEVGLPLEVFFQVNYVVGSSVRFIVQDYVGEISFSAPAPTVIGGIGITVIPAPLTFSLGTESPERIIKISQLAFTTPVATIQAASPLEQRFNYREATRDLQEGKVLDVMDELNQFSPNVDNLREARQEFWSDAVIGTVGGPLKLDRLLVNTMSYRYPMYRTNTQREAIVRRNSQPPQNSTSYIIE